ncbi:MAG: SusD/RagB family nutrient-binding outer membrane lipoprotein [Bacteroidales bacterium]|nr:SusD/RagB family nutrient-binding outer membrane lipoprotein [Bacteroidales bacterium]
MERTNRYMALYRISKSAHSFLHFKLKNLFLLLAINILLAGCSDWLDINKNPNVPGQVSYDDVLPSGISAVAYVMGGRYQVLGALWSQHWTQSPGASQYQGLDSYNINSSTFDDNQFGGLYSEALQNLEYVRQESLKENQWNYYLVATVTQAYTFQLLADLYDQVPFSEALKGDLGITEPKYESGRDIYDSLVARIDFALQQDFDDDNLKKIGNRGLIDGSDNIDLWKAFANTLKLKLFLRQTEARPEFAETEIRKLYASKTEFLKSDIRLNIFFNESGRRNPLYETEVNFFGNNPNLVLSYTLYSYLVENGDFDRLDYMFSQPENGGAHKSLAQGNYYAPGEPAGTNSSSYSKPVIQPAAPVYLMSFSEACFLQAEAIMRYQVDSYDAAREMYNEGVKACYKRIMGLSNVDVFANPLLAGKYAFPSEGSSFNDFLTSIITQKWVALSGIQSLETFFEHNRTHIPKESTVTANDNNYVPGEFTVSANNVTSNKFPRRLVFPASEYAANRYTPEKQDVWVKVWWDTKAE